MAIKGHGLTGHGLKATINLIGVINKIYYPCACSLFGWMFLDTRAGSGTRVWDALCWSRSESRNSTNDLSIAKPTKHHPTNCTNANELLHNLQRAYASI
jgi:hypothetical protein